MTPLSPTLTSTPPMNCFQWKNCVSDALDGDLPPSQQIEFDKHSQGCYLCKEKLNHYQQIRHTLKQHPLKSIPDDLKKNPLVPLSTSHSHSTRPKWEALPWYLRSSLEGLGIAFLVLFIIALVPRARMLYEHSTEKKFDTFNLAEYKAENEEENQTPPLSRISSSGTHAQSTDEENEYLSEDEESESANTPIHVGRSEVWRIMMLSDSPKEMRPKIVQALSDVGIPKNTPGFSGIEAPGGIQFDMIVSPDVISPIKSKLEAITQLANAKTNDAPTPGKSPFSWYKNKSRKQNIPNGKVRLVIWISQM